MRRTLRYNILCEKTMTNWFTSTLQVKMIFRVIKAAGSEFQYRLHIKAPIFIP